MKIIDTIKELLIGRSLNIRIKYEPIYELYAEIVKKSANVTDKQFDSGLEKYRMVAHRKRIIGYDTEFKVKKIIDIVDTGGDDYDGYIVIKLDDDTTLQLDMSSEIDLI